MEKKYDEAFRDAQAKLEEAKKDDREYVHKIADQYSTLLFWASPTMVGDFASDSQEKIADYTSASKDIETLMAGFTVDKGKVEAQEKAKADGARRKQFGLPADPKSLSTELRDA